MLYLGIAIVLLVLIGMLYLRVSRGGTTRPPASRGRHDGSYVTGAHTSTTTDRPGSSSRDGNDGGSSSGADSTPSSSDGGGSSGGDSGRGGSSS